MILKTKKKKQKQIVDAIKHILMYVYVWVLTVIVQRVFLHNTPKSNSDNRVQANRKKR